MPRLRLNGLLAMLLLVVFAAPLAAPPARAAQPSPAAAQASPVVLPAIVETEPNDTISDVSADDRANPIGAADQQTVKDWSQRVTGAIGRADDVDYFRLVVARPASSVRVTLSNLSADYDLVLAGRPDFADADAAGLEDIAEVGGRISSIGGRISSIGGRISSIGGRISSIGGRISSIGGRISSISANAGTAPEEIETTLWLPGTYYIAVASAGEQFGSGYTLDVRVTGSALNAAPRAPEVALRGRPANASPDQITTLYIMNSRRMEQLYGRASASPIALIKNYLNVLADNGPNPAARERNPGRREYGYVIDVADLQPFGTSTSTISDVYQLWDANQANPFYANFVAGLVDNIVEAAGEASGDSGSDPSFILGSPTVTTRLHLPNLKYVVLVGGDDSLPLFRLPDLTTIANESDYLAYTNTVAGGLIDPARALGAALQNRTILSDTPFGARRPYRFPGAPLFVPSLAVGRLVETPDDIARYLNRYYGEYIGFALKQQASGNDSAFRIDYSFQFGEGARAFVSGYDFLKDQAEEISATLGRAGFGPQPCGGETCTPGDVAALVGDGWNRDDLEREWFNGELSTSFSDTAPNDPFAEQRTSFSSVNAHFDHWQVLPATDAAGNFPARRLLAPDYDYSACGSFPCYPGYFGHTLALSVGCHSGYNVMPRAMTALFRTLRPTPEQQATIDLYSADFPQAVNRHGGNWIGNTGYGYGTLDGVDYSERLAALVTENLFTRVTDPLSPTVYIGQSIGDALTDARLRYLRNASSLSEYDAKALEVMTLYGLPFIRLYGFRDYLLDPPAEEGRPGAPPPAERPAPVPAPPPDGLLQRTITFTIALDQSDYRRVERTGSTVLELSPDDFTVADSWAALAGPVRVFQNNQPGAPELPRFGYDISGRNSADDARLVVRDVQFVEGSYGSVANFNPQITQIVTETNEPLIDTPTEPTFDAGAGIWYPDKFFGFSSVGEGDDARDQLVSAAAQFRANADGATGLLRPYTRMVFRVTYIDPSASAADRTLSDTTAPTIDTVRLEQGDGRQGPRTRIVVLLGDDDDTNTVQANVVVGDAWRTIVFTRPDPAGAPNRYVAELPQLIGDVRAIVRATDAAGNTSYYTAKGRFAPPRQPALFLPLLRK